MNIADLRFLAVEDHEFQRGVLLGVLAGLGATNVSGVADGLAALKIVQARRPPVDIILSDLDMPGMDGMEFMRHLSEGGIPVSIILVSALGAPLLASAQTMTRAFGVNVLGVMEKPVTRAKLAALIGLYTPEPPRASFPLEEILQGLNNEEFEPFFQPQVDLVTDKVTGAEALARWRHPRHGIVAPSAFIGTLEKYGQIDALTRVVLRASAGLCRTWRASSGLDVTVSVNLSMKSLADIGLAERVTQLVQREGLEPEHMVLELKESAATTQVAEALENLSRLRMKGFGLSIDDYGTGHSSMQQLTRVALTQLKIDRSFVARAVGEKSAESVVQASLDMARKLNIASVATGVETQQQWVLARQLCCHTAQGYFIARPMPAKAFLEWSGARSADLS
jgi:EAL domain-containing protein (putative c-di-GMP-specific phosphodiesterase class I)